jgi:polyisoprenoid-binding protein YceI
MFKSVLATLLSVLALWVTGIWLGQSAGALALFRESPATTIAWLQAPGAAGWQPTAQPITTVVTQATTGQTASPYTPTADVTPVATSTPQRSPATGKKQTFLIVSADTTVSYAIHQVLFNEGNRMETVTGKTSQVAGQLTLNYDDPSASQFGEFSVNLSTLTSGEHERDDTLQTEWLESVRFPLAKFVVKEIRNFPPDAQPGQVVEFQLAGDMSIKDVTRLTTWDVAATLNRDLLTGKAVTVLQMADFGVPLPGIAGLLSVTDGVTVTLDFTFKTAKPVSTPGGT